MVKIRMARMIVVLRRRAAARDTQGWGLLEEK